jgi:agmatine deiminase
MNLQEVSKAVFLIFFFFIFGVLSSLAQTYFMPAEGLLHEGTWLQWPHQYEYGVTYRNRLDQTWVAMTDALVKSENVHIIAYDNAEKIRVTNLLQAASVNMAKVDFQILKTNDVWIRDNGPIFAKDSSGNLIIEDWGFNGWGGDYNYNLDDPIPGSLGALLGMGVLNLNAVMTLEGGAYELDGNGVLLACRSSIISQSPANSVRNPGMNELQAEAILAQYIGAMKFIWLDGFTGSEDITDAHIDGLAKFVNDSVIMTMSNADLLYWGLSSNDISTLYSASDLNNRMYNKVYLPLTQNDVVTTYGKNLGYKGSYINYYVANSVVLVPNYNDPNDAIANGIIQAYFPGRTVMGIDVRNLYENGGMVHCVTQQQPLFPMNTFSIQNSKNQFQMGQIFPNPVCKNAELNVYLEKKSLLRIEIYSSTGHLITPALDYNCSAGNQILKMNFEVLKTGVYNALIRINNESRFIRRFVVINSK